VAFANLYFGAAGVAADLEAVPLAWRPLIEQRAALEGLDGTAVMIESIAGVPGRFLRLGGDGCQAARWACLARSSKAA